MHDFVGSMQRMCDGSEASVAYVKFLMHFREIYVARAGTSIAPYVRSGKAHILTTTNMTATISTESLQNVRIKCIVHLLVSRYPNVDRPDEMRRSTCYPKQEKLDEIVQDHEIFVDWVRALETWMHRDSQYKYVDERNWQLFSGLRAQATPCVQQLEYNHKYVETELEQHSIDLMPQDYVDASGEYKTMIHMVDTLFAMLGYGAYYIYTRQCNTHYAKPYNFIPAKIPSSTFSAALQAIPRIPITRHVQYVFRYKTSLDILKRTFSNKRYRDLIAVLRFSQTDCWN
jgi:hypothetical protein